MGLMKKRWPGTKVILSEERNVLKTIMTSNIYLKMIAVSHRGLHLNHCFSYFQKQPPEGFCKKGVLRNFTKFIGKPLYQRLFFKKVAYRRPATLLKKRLWHRSFPVNFVKFLRTPFLQNTSWRLLFLFYLNDFDLASTKKSHICW